MNRAKKCLYLNLGMIVDLVPILLSGAILWLALPGGQRRGGFETFWGLTRHTWIDVHLWASLFLIALIFGHLVLHLEYLKDMPKMLRRG
jgi:hypothetical protein